MKGAVITETPSFRWRGDRDSRGPDGGFGVDETDRGFATCPVLEKEIRAGCRLEERRGDLKGEGEGCYAPEI